LTRTLGIAIALFSPRRLQVQDPAFLMKSEAAKGMLVPLQDRRHIEKMMFPFKRCAKNEAVALSVGNRGTNLWRVGHCAGQKQRGQTSRMSLPLPGLARSAATRDLGL
jgi:hypothetical protein